MFENDTTELFWNVANPTFQSLWLLSGYPLQRVAVNKKVMEPRVPSS